MTLMFVVLIAYSLATEGAHIAQSAARGTPEQLLAQPIFTAPGVRATGPNQYDVSLVGQAFVWQPETVRVPVGAEVTFYLTARDVIHGWQVENTNLNVEVIPGEVSRLRTTFDEPGRYRVSCNEYCGIGHQNMIGWIEVVPASQLVAAEAPAATGPADGAAVYASNCASCHGANGAGIAGVFPPLAGHAADLAALDGGRTYLIDALLYGLQGAIVIDGTTYDGVDARVGPVGRRGDRGGPRAHRHPRRQRGSRLHRRGGRGRARQGPRRRRRPGAAPAGGRPVSATRRSSPQLAFRTATGGPAWP